VSWHGEDWDGEDLVNQDSAGGSSEAAHSGGRDTPGTRVVMPGERGPVLVQGPVEIVLDDGTAMRSDRPMVALCACGRSRRYPFCDTSHRRRTGPIR
jgi:hypothetical protein